MEINRTLEIKLTGKEYNLLREAAHLIENITTETDSVELGYEYELYGIPQEIYAFLDDPKVTVDWND